MTDSLRAAYEATTYHSKPIAETHASSIEGMAVLHGLSPTPSDRCRVLELGCATGGNLIAMAYQLPESRFVGIDLAPTQIDEGNRTIAALGLANIQLATKSISDIGDEFGIFDYIICHGVYSWVPPEVQDAILRVCSRNLSPTGLAYVSYNVYPGWHQREMIRDMLLVDDDPALPPRERIARARNFLEHLVSSVATVGGIHAQMVIDEAETLRKQTDYHLLHEQLEQYNQPMYFAEFATRAAEHGLRYVCDAKLSSSSRRAPDWVNPGAESNQTNAIRTQQYIDFIRGRTFRASLLCHDFVSVSPPTPDLMPHFHFSMIGGRGEPSAEDAAKGGTVEAFRSYTGKEMSTNMPLLSSALRVLLKASPAALSFQTLLDRVVDRLSADAVPGISDDVPAAGLAPTLAVALLECGGGDLIQLLYRPASCAARVSARPRASAIARLRARNGETIPNLRHMAIKATELERLILPLLDGTNTRDDLLVAIERAGGLSILSTDGQATDPASLSAGLDLLLKRFAASAVLEA